MPNQYKKNYISSLSGGSSYNPPTYKPPKKTGTPYTVGASAYSLNKSNPAILGDKTIKGLGSAGGAYVANKPTPSDTSATGTTGTKITSPVGKEYVNTLMQGTQNPVSFSGTTTASSDSSYKDEPDYKEYIKYIRNKENPSEELNQQKMYQNSLKTLADIQNKKEKLEYDARKDYNKILDMEGGLKGGTRQGAAVYNRRATDDITDLALQESAAARTAGVYQDLSKDAKKEGFSLSEGQIRYEYNPESGTYESVGVGASKTDTKGDELLSPTEAQLLGVPYGTTRAQAYGTSPTNKPTEEQSKARQFAVSAKNADDILNTSTYDIGNVEVSSLPNAFKSEERQVFEQAARAFVNSVLRRESGATITDDEFKNKYKELIPQAGDRADVLANKKSARAAAVQSIIAAGGQTQTQGNVMGTQTTIIQTSAGPVNPNW